MDRGEFERLVARAVESLPDEFRAKLENVDVVVQDWPTRSQQAKLKLKRCETLLGLYEGVPQTKRSHYGMVPPDKITIFQKTIEAKCGQHDTLIAAEIAKVVRHEIAHHFGISDKRLEQIKKGRGG
jgi:predicted Zn-dependent protease with MMP-like domain